MKKKEAQDHSNQINDKLRIHTECRGKNDNAMNNKKDVKFSGQHQDYDRMTVKTVRMTTKIGFSFVQKTRNKMHAQS